MIIKTEGLDIELDCDDYFFCTYSPHMRGDIRSNTGWYKKINTYAAWWDRVKNKPLTNEKIKCKIPVYNPEFTGERTLIFKFGRIYITHNFKSQVAQDFSFLKDKMLYIQFDPKGSAKLLMKGKRRKQNEKREIHTT